VVAKKIYSSDDYSLPNLPLLDVEEERELLKQVAEAKEERNKEEQGKISIGALARNKLILSNQALVRRIAYKYINKGVEYSDLVAEGIVGLIIGIDKFDVTKGFRLSTYVVWWIKKAIREIVQQQQEEEIYSDDEDLEDSRYQSLVSESLVQQEIQCIVDGMNKCCSIREIEVLDLYYGIGRSSSLTLREVGKKLGCSRQAATKIRDNAIRKLKKMFHVEKGAVA
jgi:RNA polymerase sigma factor (sigma-70 family)